MSTRQPPLFPDLDAAPGVENCPQTGDRAPGVPDPQCPRCNGSGVILAHSEWCRNESCTIGRHRGDCHGKRRKCRCMRVARVASPALPGAELFDRAMDRIVVIPTNDNVTRADVLYVLRARKAARVFDGGDVEAELARVMADALALCEGLGAAGPGLSSVLLGVLEALARSRRANKRGNDVDSTID